MAREVGGRRQSPLRPVPIRESLHHGSSLCFIHRPLLESHRVPAVCWQLGLTHGLTEGLLWGFESREGPITLASWGQEGREPFLEEAMFTACSKSRGMRTSSWGKGGATF